MRKTLFIFPDFIWGCCSSNWECCWVIFNTVIYIFVLAVQYLLNIQYLDDGFHEVGSQFVACIFCRLSSSILKVSYLLHEHPVSLLAPTNNPSMKCEKTEVNNSFESILDEDVPCCIKGTLMQIWKFPFMFVFIQK